jgi:lipopolysaccharide export system protein LptC
MGAAAVMAGPNQTKDAPVQRPTGRQFGRFAAWMRIVLPVIAAMLLGLVLAWPKIMPMQETVLPMFPKAQESGSGEARVRNLQFSGFDKDARPFKVTAEEGIQPDPGGDAIILERPNADIGLKDDAWLAARADRGYYNRKTEQLRLDGSVNLFHDRGFELRTERVNVDLKNGIAWGDDAVEAVGPQGVLRSEGLRVLDKGRRVIFTGQSHLTFEPDRR